MPGVQGRTTRMAFAKYAANSWNVAASVTKGAYFDAEGFRYAPTFAQDNPASLGWLGAPEPADVDAVSGTVSQIQHYDDYAYILDGLAMGSPAAVTISTSATGQVTSWKHVFDLADTIAGLGLTLAIDKTQYVDEITNAKVTGFTEGDGDGQLKVSYSLLGNQLINTSSVNINSTVWGATFPALGNRALRKHGTLRINSQGSGSLVAADAVVYDSAEVSFERPMDSVHKGGDDKIIEPGDNGFPTGRLRVTFPRMDSTTANRFMAQFPGGIAFKGDATWAGAYINSTDKWTRQYQFPAMIAEEFAANVAGPGQVKPAITFGLYAPASAPTGMAGVTKPFRLNLIRVNSVAAF